LTRSFHVGQNLSLQVYSSDKCHHCSTAISQR